jgi:hypothetical protein
MDQPAGPDPTVRHVGPSSGSEGIRQGGSSFASTHVTGGLAFQGNFVGLTISASFQLPRWLDADSAQTLRRPPDLIMSVSSLTPRWSPLEPLFYDGDFATKSGLSSVEMR